MHLTADKFVKLFLECKGGFENIAFSYVNDPDAAKDIVTDSFTYLWEHRESLEGEDNVEGYLYLCVRARCISWLRKRQAAMKATDIMKWRIETGINSLSGNETSDKIFQSEIMGILQKTIMEMPDITRDIFLASREDKMTYSEISGRFGISVRKVTSEIQRALAIIRYALKDYVAK